MSEETADHIAALEDARYAAMLAGDVPALEALLHPGLRYIHSKGEVDGREDYLGNMRGGTMVYHAITREARHIEVVGDTALSICRLRMAVTFNGGARVVFSSALAVWVRDATGWRLLAQQSAALPPSP